MKTERLMSILRALLSIVGGFILGHNIFGLDVDETLWQEFLGSVLALSSIILSVIDKTANIEKIEGAARQILSFSGAALVARGILSAQQFATIFPALIVLLPLLLGKTSTTKTKALDTGKLSIADLKK